MKTTRLGLVALLLAVLPACAGKSPDPSSPANDGESHSARAARHDRMGTSGGEKPAHAGRDSRGVGTAAATDLAQSESKAYEPMQRDQVRAPMPAEEAAPLATEYGERHSSSVRGVDFSRASDAPDVVLALRYDAAARLGYGEFLSSGARVSGMSFAGPLSLSLTDTAGEPLHAVSLQGEAFAIGRLGERYMVGVENGSSERFEAVVSVDGLDVLDGGDAGFHKRGYLVEPYSSTMIEGWRTSYQEVAAFRFSAIEDGYGARTGRGRNSGVVGVAFFREQAPPQFVPPPPPRHDPRYDSRPDPFPGGR